MILEFHNYLKVAEEFFEWAFLSPDERVEKEQQEQEYTDAIRKEVENIERTLCFINGTIGSSHADS